MVTKLFYAVYPPQHNPHHLAGFRLVACAPLVWPPQLIKLQNTEIATTASNFIDFELKFDVVIPNLVLMRKLPLMTEIAHVICKV